MVRLVGTPLPLLPQNLGYHQTSVGVLDIPQWQKDLELEASFEPRVVEAWEGVFGFVRGETRCVDISEKYVMTLKYQSFKHMYIMDWS